MSLLTRLDLDELSPAGLWSALDDATREEAVRSVYNDGPGGGKLEADMAIANALRFRPGAVKQLPLERRVGYMLKAVHIDDGLASTILLAFHLDGRADILEAFLDELGIPQQGGLIEEGYELQPPDREELARAVDTVYERFDVPRTDLYLAALLALDPVTWSGLRDVIVARRG
jgi:hypothetical protein